VANLILGSNHFIAFTGAGISTACGVPDFRSGVNTVLKTGPGAWEKKAQGVK
jgi:NAD-dependent SIR2 family protein deacetylase